MIQTPIQVTFLPGGRTVQVETGMTLMEAGARAGLVINTPCGGAGTCGKCRIRFEETAPAAAAAEEARLSAQDRAEGWRLACQTRLTGDAVVYVPPSSLFGGEHQIQTKSAHDTARAPDSAVRRVALEMPLPSLHDSAPDMTRLERALATTLPDWGNNGDALSAGPELLRILGGRLRETAFKGIATVRERRLIDYESLDNARPLYALAFDVGTTTLVGALLDIATGEEKGIVSFMNPQTFYGDDVLSRIAYAGRDNSALTEIHECLLEAVRDGIARLCETAEIAPQQICDAVFTGNATMQHLLCGFNPASLGAAPFVPVHKRGLVMAAADMGLDLHPEAQTYIFPVIGGFVGGDTVAGLLAAEMSQAQGPTLMIDIGTNGEIALACNGTLRAASTAAGPAFEGARISCGMRATNGAIEKVTCDDDLAFSVIGGVAPTGLCGSGLIDLCAVLLKSGVLRCDGRLLTGDELPPSVPPALRDRVCLADDGEPQCVLVKNSGRNIALTQRDVREVQLGAGAIRAGINILLKQAGISPGELRQVLIAGGFGSFIRRDNAQRIGLIPSELPHDEVRFAGNVAFSGAKWAAVSRAARTQAEQLAAMTSHVELNQDPDFAMEFAMAMQFPEP